MRLALNLFSFLLLIFAYLGLTFGGGHNFPWVWGNRKQKTTKCKKYNNIG